MAGEAMFTVFNNEIKEAELNISFRKWLHEKYPNGFSGQAPINNAFVEVAYLAWCAGITYRRDQENA